MKSLGDPERMKYGLKELDVPAAAEDALRWGFLLLLSLLRLQAAKPYILKFNFKH